MAVLCKRFVDFLATLFDTRRALKGYYPGSYHLPHPWPNILSKEKFRVRGGVGRHFPIHFGRNNVATLNNHSLGQWSRKFVCLT